MSSPTTFDAFYERLTNPTTGWEAISGIPIRFENEFCQDLLDRNVAAFVYFEIFGDSYDQESFGAPGQNMFLEQGVAYGHVMTPSGSGSSQGRQYANQLLNMFREQPIGQLFMPQMSIGTGEPGQDFPNYFSMAASIRWRRRDITNIP